MTKCKIFPTTSGKSEYLSWSHYALLWGVDDDSARNWYAHEAFVEIWECADLAKKHRLSVLLQAS